VLVVGAAYYLGSLAGLAFRLPPATPSLIWPPNAILTAALLLTAPRQWLWCLAGAFVPHLFVQSGVGWPWTLITALFLTNCLEALVGAVGLRLLSDAPTRFDTFRRVAAFIVTAGVAGPVVSSFADAAVVSVVVGEPYWQVWQMRTFANVLTELSVVPVLVLGWRAFRDRVPIDPSYAVEVLVVGAALAETTLLVIRGGMPGAVMGVPPTPTAFLLPFLFWAAVRLGLAGISGGLLVVSAVASRAALQGASPFAFLPPIERLMAFQMYLVMMAIPLMCVSALLDERRSAVRRLGDRLRFEELVSHISRLLLGAGRGGVGSALGECVRVMGEALNADRVWLVEPGPEGEAPAVSHQWEAPGSTPLAADGSAAALPWALSVCGARPAITRVVAGRPVGVPAELVDDWAGLALSSAMVLPLVDDNRLLGVLTIAAHERRGSWSSPALAEAQLLMQVIANALSRQRSEDALKSSESIRSAILGSLSSEIAVLDRHGRIIGINRAWGASVEGGAAAGVASAPLGADLLASWRSTSSDGASQSEFLAHGLELVLRGADGRFAAEFLHRSSVGDDRWYAVSAVPLSRAEGGAVVSQVDITDQRRSEMEIRRMHVELAQVARVSTMGELAVSLAHQINQPLGAIMANAQAARRLLEAQPPDIPQFRLIVEDTIEDVVRASDVVGRMREMITRSDTPPACVDLNALARDIQRFVSSDALIRNISVGLNLTFQPPWVSGNRVDLQQVVLNLVVNAMEAVVQQPAAERRVVIETAHSPDGRVSISVSDSGPGVADGMERRMFEPFATTKPHGMGMGLAIARSIVEAHAGNISAQRLEPGGLAFTVALPAAAVT
jgi:two-component system sensor kinase FixL